MLKFEFKEASAERKAEMLLEIISKYNVSNKNELIQALGHSQAVLDCTQDDFATNPRVSISTRQLRTHKKEYLDIYTSAFERYSVSPQLKNVDTVIDEDVLETVYQNLLARLKSPKTPTKEMVVLTEYFGVTKEQFKGFANFRNSTMRAYVADNLTTLVPEESTSVLIKSVITESPFLYQGTEKTLGNSLNAKNMDLNKPIVRLEAQTLGLLFISLFNGNITDQFFNHAETLRLLKLSAGDKAVKEGSYMEFDRMDGRQPASKPFSPTMEKDLIEWFGEGKGKEMFAQLIKLKDKVADKTAIKLPKYEDVSKDYEVHLKEYPEVGSMPFRVLLAKLNARHDNQYKEKYKQFLEVNEE